MNYLEYLVGYMSKAAYIKYIKHPVCLDYAQLLLKSEAFRAKLKDKAFMEMALF